MSNLNTHGVVDFESAKSFLGDKSARTLCFATTLTHESIGEAGVTAITVRHHGSPIIRYRSDGQIEIRNAGWLSSTTTDRLHRMTPTSVRVSRAKGGHVESPLYSGPQPSYDFVRVI
jgi:hypothetical protein